MTKKGKKMPTIAQVGIVATISLAIILLFLILELIFTIFTNIKTLFILTDPFDKPITKILSFST